MSETLTTSAHRTSTPTARGVVSLRRAIVKAVVLVTIGVALAVFGSLSLHSTNAVCGRDKMQPGDSCLMTDGSHKSYSAMVDKERQSARFAAGLGGLLVISGARGVVTVVRRRQR